jgi:polyhydroxybutyrate depolymerase
MLAACSSGTTAAPSPTPTPCDPGAPGTREVSVGNRSFLLHVPRDFRNPSPVVFTFHGRGSNSQQQLLLTGFEQVSEEGRFLVVAPNAVNGRWDLTGTSDFEYLQEVAAAVPCMDSTRVYASGMSMGSGMTFALACAPDRKFAAFGGVALTLFRPICDQAPPAPIIYFHGTSDPIVPFRGGRPEGEDVRLPAAPVAMVEWAEHNGCQAGDVQRVGKDVKLRTWTECTANAAVDYYRVQGGGHTWPGTTPIIADAIEQSLGRTTQTVNASRLMWEFFEGYSLS